MLTSTRYGINYPDPARTDSPDVPRDFGSVVTAIEKSTMYNQGLFSARPVSSGGSPGIQGRFYYATDTGIIYYDFGTGWIQVSLDPAATTDGWSALPGAWLYGTTDGHTFTMTSVTADYTGLIQPGMRLKLTHAAAVKYFIVTAVAFATGTTTITLYGGQNYVITNSALTALNYSTAKAPFGFPLDPTIWTDILRDTSDRTQASPVSGTWYNLGALSIAIPIGIWEVKVSILVEQTATGQPADHQVSVSTSASSESDIDLSSRFSLGSNQLNTIDINHKFSTKPIVLAAKTTYFPIVKPLQTLTNAITFKGTVLPTTIRAICAYL